MKTTTKKYSDTITVRQKSMEIFRLSKWRLFAC